MSENFTNKSCIHTRMLPGPLVHLRQGTLLSLQPVEQVMAISGILDFENHNPRSTISVAMCIFKMLNSHYVK